MSECVCALVCVLSARAMGLGCSSVWPVQMLQRDKQRALKHRAQCFAYARNFRVQKGIRVLCCVLGSLLTQLVGEA